MAQSKSEIQSLLAGVNTAGPRHRFGQNFMIDGNLVRLVADAGELSSADWCLEVGPGTGTLTEELLASADCVVILTAHPGVDYSAVVAASPLIFDATGTLRSTKADHVILL